MIESAHTLPRFLVQNYKKYGDRKVAMRRKNLGFWQEYTWKDSYEKVKYFSLGLISLGLKPEDKVAILGDNDPEWFWAEYATMAARGITFGMYPDSTAAEVKYLVLDSDCRFVVAADQEQIDKILEIKDEVPLLVKAIYWDPKGLWDYDDPIIMSFDEVIELGRNYEKIHPETFEENIAQAKPEDPAIMCYTSGTTGEHPKGVILSNRALVEGYAKDARSQADITDSWEYLSYICPSWVAEQGDGLAVPVITGMIVNFPETADTSQADMREIGPNFQFFTSRHWESISSAVQAKIGDTNALFRFCYNLILPIGYKVADGKMRDETPNLFWRALAALAEITLFRPVKDRFGLLKLKAAVTGGAVTSPDTFRFFRAIGVNLKQVYGLTEGGFMSCHRDNDVKFHSVGVPMPGNEVRLSDEGELLSRSASILSGYYKRPEVTSKILKNGWVHSGDAGYIGDDGHLVYYDRVKDMVDLPDGTKYAPQYIESRLKFSPYVKDVMVIGGDKAFVSALVNIDFDNVGKWAEKRHIPYTTFVDLSQKPEVHSLVKKALERVNRTQPDSAKVRKFVCMPKEFDADEAELTRTRKLRRPFVESRYADLIKAIYEGKSEFVTEAEVKYRDGRKAAIRTAVTLVSVGDKI